MCVRTPFGQTVTFYKTPFVRKHCRLTRGVLYWKYKAIAKLVFPKHGLCNMDTTKSGCYGAAGTYVPYFGTLCTAASDKQRECARVGLSILHKAFP